MSNYEIILSENDLAFAKVRPDAIIPTKDEENAGRDVYANFEEDYMIIPPHTTKLIPTGIASALHPKYEIRLRDRGSNGSKGIHVNAGTIDSGYRGEWFVAWCNTNDKPVILSKLSEDELKKKTYANIFNEMVLPSFEDTEPEQAIGEVDLAYKEVFWDFIYYPYTKAIAQAEVCEVPVMHQFEVDYEQLKSIPSKRGTGALGSSGK